MLAFSTEMHLSIAVSFLNIDMYTSIFCLCTLQNNKCRSEEQETGSRYKDVNGSKFVSRKLGYLTNNARDGTKLLQ